MTSDEVSYYYVDTPLGSMMVVGNPEGLIQISFVEEQHPGAPSEKRHFNRLLERAVDQLRAYFDGRLREFELPLVLRGTRFQLEVWRALQQIPYGVTVSYGELAKRLGRPAAVRAVGAANGQNPIAIVIPCHRVIGSDGSLTGYGGGIEKKAALLRLERALQIREAQVALFS